MKKYLFISNSTKPSESEYKSREDISLTNVSRPCIEAAMGMGYKIYMGVNRDKAQELKSEYDITFYNSSTYRSLLDFKSNYMAFKNLRSLLKSEKIDVIHCNTPIGGLVARLCGKLENVPKVIYTAHGFHFYKGAPLFNRTVIKIAEKWMAKYTDAIITMNNEDFQAANQFKLRNNGKVYKVPGVGIDTEDYSKSILNKEKIRSELGLSEDDVVLISMGDLVARKNYSTAIKALAEVKQKDVKYLICGTGPELENLKHLVKELELEDSVFFLGFRKDIKELLAASDVFLFTTLQEGLPRSLMEAMATGLPCITSKIRGNVDLLEDGMGGYLIETNNTSGYAMAIDRLVQNKNLRVSMGKHNLKVIKTYDVSNVKKIIKKIYEEVLIEE